MTNMMQNDARGQYPQQGTPEASTERIGCLQVLLFVLMAGWVIFLTAVAQFVTWLAEQEPSAGIPAGDDRWLILIFYGLGLLMPAGLIWATGRRLGNRRVFGGFALAACFTLLLAPARLAGVANAYATSVLLIAGMLLFLLLLHLILPRRRAGWQGAALALLVGGLVGFPWVAWGALGSGIDVVLNLLTALLFGLTASRVMAFIFAREQESGVGKLAVLLDGLAALLVLLIFSTGLGVNGNQLLVSLSLAPLGWALAGLYRFTVGGDQLQADNGLALALLLALAAFWPIAFVDPDEMAAALSIAVGELGQWAYLAAFTGLVLALLAGLLLGLMHSRDDHRRTTLLTGLVILTWLGCAGLYVSVGQPGFFGERLFVILKDQADVSAAVELDDYSLRRLTVYSLLTEKADASQADLRASLDGWQIPYHPYYLVNAIEVQGGPLVRLWLAQRPDVDRVLESPRLRPLPAAIPQSSGFSDAPDQVPWNLEMIGANKAWEELGITGKGIIVGQSDSGVQGDHPELADSYRGRASGQDYNWFDPWNSSGEPTDIGGHGTHTLATVVGNQVGVAPDAEWIGCVNLGRNLANPALYLDCLQFMLAPFPQNGNPFQDGRPELGAHVLNNSWGCPPIEGCDPDALLSAVSALRAAGVFVVSSAGNDGENGCESVAEPLALYDQVYSVGALDSQRNLTSFSSLGPVSVDGSQRVKPDITAPGGDVLSAFPGNTYSTLSGTSMAGPHVAGVVALMWSANPNLIGDIERTEQILNETAAPYTGALPGCVSPGYPNSAVGYGIVDAYGAVLRALEDEEAAR